MVLSLCGGSPGGKDELNPGNGSTAKHDAALAKAAALDVAKGRVEGASAQDDTHAAAEAALQVMFYPSSGRGRARTGRRVLDLIPCMRDFRQSAMHLLEGTSC